MTATLIPMLVFQPMQKSSTTGQMVPIPGGKLYTYAAGTTTPLAVYSDTTGTTPLANPVILDANGIAQIYLGTASYKFLLTDSAGATIYPYPIDNVQSEVAAAATFTNLLRADLASTASAAVGDGMVGVKVGTVATTQHELNARTLNAKDYGTDLSSAITAIGATQTQLIVSNSITVTGNTTVPATLELVVLNGGLLTISTGVTLTINGPFSAGIYQTFNCVGTGSVVFDPTKIETGYPEWWGATCNNNSTLGKTATTAAINACLAACKVTKLQSGDYWTDGPVTMLLAHRSLIGSGWFYDDSTNQVTRLLCDSDSSLILQVGPNVEPTGDQPNVFYRENVVEDVFITRAVAPSVTSGCVGVLIQWTLGASLKNVRSSESIYCFWIKGTVALQADHCWAFRSLAGTGGTDSCVGWYIDGTATIGLSGGNGSVYLNYCKATAGISITGSSGFYLNAAFTDVFLETPESSAFATGISIIGDNDNTTTGRYTNIDLQIKNPTLDTFTFAGIYAYQVNKYGSVSIKGGYYGAYPLATAAVYISACLGSINVDGGQFVMGLQVGGVTDNKPMGVYIANSTGAIVNRPQILECRSNAVALDGASFCDIRPLVKNVEESLSGAPVQMYNTCTRNYIAPIFVSKASACGYGVLGGGAGHTYNHFDLTGVAPASVTSTKLNINSTAITATGLTGTNFVSGVIA